MEFRRLREEDKGSSLREQSDSSLVAIIVGSLTELVRRELMREMAFDPQKAVQHVSLDLPFSRADGRDYLRIVELWNTYRSTTTLHLPARNCPACDSSSSCQAFESYDKYEYHVCEACGTWFVPYEVNGTVIEAFFSAFPEAKGLSEKMMSGRESVSRELDRQRFRHYFEMLSSFTRGRESRIRYLDIGCGVGHSVELASELGWHGKGLELDRVAVEMARKAGRNVGQSIDWDSVEKFDLISLFETLEHVPHPGPLFSNLVRALAPGGLVMITVPQSASFELSILRGHSFHVFGGCEAVGHINLFDRRGLSALLGRHELELMFVDSQYGSDLFQIFNYIATNKRSMLDNVKDGHLDLTMRETAYMLINNLGPIVSLLERGLKRSPILIAIACRSTDRECLAPVFEELQQNWRNEMLRLIEAGSAGAG